MQLITVQLITVQLITVQLPPIYADVGVIIDIWQEVIFSLYDLLI